MSQPEDRILPVDPGPEPTTCGRRLAGVWGPAMEIRCALPLHHVGLCKFAARLAVPTPAIEDMRAPHERPPSPDFEGGTE